MSAYPEHDKLSAIKDESQAIGEFIETGGYVLAEYRLAGDNGKPRWNPEYEAWGEALVPVGRSITVILADYFAIDLAKIEAEKRAMLDQIRSAHQQGA